MELEKDDKIVVEHLHDLLLNCRYKNVNTYSPFLTISQQQSVYSLSKDNPDISIVLDGGYSLAERKVALFSLKGVSDYAETPFSVVKISPKSEKYGEQLNHRDVLGTLMGLGIKREQIGDILTDSHKCAYLFVLNKMTDFIINEITRIRHTDVVLSQIDKLPEEVKPKVEERSGSVASLRLDAILAFAFHQSRSQINDCIRQEKVWVNGKQIINTSYIVQEKDIVSARGFGKFIFNEAINETKKGRLWISIGMYSS